MENKNTTATSRLPLGNSTPGRLKPPSKIAQLALKPISLGLTKADPSVEEENVVPQEDHPPTSEAFPVHNTSLKRKPEVGASGPATRNTRLRTESGEGVGTGTTKTTRVSGVRTTALAKSRVAAPRTTAPRTTSGTTRTLRPGVTGARAPAAKTSATVKAAAPAKNPAPDSTLSGPPKKKRAAYDVKGRLQDLEEYNNDVRSELSNSKTQISNLTEELSSSRSTINELISFRQTLENQVVVKEQENHTYVSQLTNLKNEQESLKRRHEEELAICQSRHKRELDDVNQELDKLKRNYNNLEEELTSAKEENSRLRSTISSQSTLTITLEADCRANKLRLEQTEETVRIRDARVAELETALADAQALAQTLESKVREEETMRRKLHNTIQELKGNIRVFCRVRPPLQGELSDKSDEILSHIGFSDNDDKIIELRQSVESASGQKAVAKAYPFSFDRVFQPGTKQLEVFDEISQLVQSALDGYNVCIFAYGQTGSGKTFTMEGPSNATDDSEQMGMIPRAVLQIFATAQALQEKGWTYEMEAQYLEIYNESIRDLIGGGSTTGEDKKHDIKHHPVTGKTSVTEIQTVQVTTPAEVHNVLKKASHNRAVAATNCNERSSRSHSVFTLRLTGYNSLTSESSQGILNLIDLAGSERLSSSGSTGDRLKETQAINKSLSCLGDVIYALANGDKFVPYRNSKLTYLLQGSLGGNSKTLMFVNVSPLAGSFQETLCSLRFATKVNSCQIGTAKKLVKQ